MEYSIENITMHNPSVSHKSIRLYLVPKSPQNGVMVMIIIVLIHKCSYMGMGRNIVHMHVHVCAIVILLIMD